MFKILDAAKCQLTIELAVASNLRNAISIEKVFMGHLQVRFFEILTNYWRFCLAPPPYLLGSTRVILRTITLNIRNF